MKANSIRPTLSSLFCMLLIMLGCSKEPDSANVPEATAENCKDENVRKISDRAVREALASRCFRHGTFEPSPTKSW